MSTSLVILNIPGPPPSLISAPFTSLFLRSVDEWVKSRGYNSVEKGEKLALFMSIVTLGLKINSCREKHRRGTLQEDEKCRYQMLLLPCS